MNRLVHPRFAYLVLLLLALLLTLLLSVSTAQAQTTTFTYQGRFTDSQNGGNATNGTYDFQFKLFDALSGGNQLGSVDRNGVAVTNSTFTVQLDFGPGVFQGANRFLEIGVRPAGGGNFSTLTPRQPVTSTPYSIRSLSAATADTATNATNATNAATAVNLSGALAGDVTGTQGATTVARLRGQPVAGTAPTAEQVLKYNGTTNQWEPAADNNSGGTLTGVTAGTGLSGGGTNGNVTLNIANGGVGTTQLADNGVTDAKIVSVSGGKITGAVANATNAVNATNATNATTATNATNAVNATNATNATTAVNFSAALGGDVTGNQSATTVAKLRNVSLPAPVVADNGKVLKYKNNGVDPITLEWATDNISAAGGVTSVTASGPLASSGGATPNLSLTGVVPAANGGTGLSAVGAAGNLLRSNGTAWTSAALQAADVPDLGAGYLKNSITQQVSSNFNISGNGTAGGTLSANIVNATTQYNIGGSRVLTSSLSGNLFAGVGAGMASAGGGGNTFFGTDAGLEHQLGSSNSYFGEGAGRAFQGQANAFFGWNAGQARTVGARNTAIGSNTNVGSNPFPDNPNENTVIGAFANASVGSGALTNATAIGAFARVTQNNSLVLGSIAGVNGASASANVGIGTTAPLSRLDIAATGDGAELLRFSTERPWVFRQVRTGSVAGLQLRSTVGQKAFEITTVEGNNVATFLADSTASKVGIGTTTPTERLSVNGNLTVFGFIQLGGPGFGGESPLCRNVTTQQIAFCGSSLRYKKDLAPFVGGLEILNRLRPISFTWKASGTRDLGLGAEDVAKVEPLLVTHNDKGEIEGVKYDRLNVILINAVKQQQEQIETLRAQNAGLNARLRAVEQVLRKKAGAAPRRR